MNGDVSSKLADLEEAFLSCQDMDDYWKLSLCYLVERLLLAHEPWSTVNIDFLSFVEDDFFFFFQYPWGMNFYHKAINGVDKDTVHY